MKRKRMTKRIAAIILAAVMMIPTHVTSFAADASAQNSTGQEESNATSGDSQTTQSENNAATQNGSSAGNPFGLYNRQATMNYSVSYDGLKRSIKNICLQTNRTGIESVSVAFDETTGLLVGSTVVNMYCVPGQEGKEYREPDFSSVLLGTDNIFGTIKIQGESALPDLEQAEETEEE